MQFDKLDTREVEIFRYRQGDMEYHSHPFLELVYITHGSALHYLDGKSEVVTCGDYFIIDYDSHHKYQSLDNENFELINCLFKPSFIDPVLENCKSFSELLGSYLIRFGSARYCCPPTRCIYKDTDGEILNLISSMMREQDENRRGAVEIMRCRLTELLIITMRKILEIGAETDDENISAAAKYISKNYMTKTVLSEVSDYVGLQPQYLSARFKKIMGMTMTEYLQRVRVGQSCRLLGTGDKKIIEVAELSGYNDLKFFNLVFKKYMGITPREFRSKSRTK